VDRRQSCNAAIHGLCDTSVPLAVAVWNGACSGNRPSRRATGVGASLGPDQALAMPAQEKRMAAEALIADAVPARADPARVSPTQKATAKTKRLNSCEQSKWLRCERSGGGAASGIRSSGRRMATPIKTPDQASRVGKRRTSDGAEPRTVGPSSRTPGPAPAAVEGGEDDGSPTDRKKIAVNTAEDPGAPVRLRVTRSRRNTINAPSSRRLFEENT